MLGERVEKREDCSKWKEKRSKQVGGKVEKSGKSPKLKNKGLTVGTIYANITVLCEEPPTGEACIRMEATTCRITK